MSDKLPPNSTTSERAIIAALLLDADAYGRVAGIVSPDDFFGDANRIIYEACVEVAQRGDPPTVPLVSLELSQRDQLDNVGGEYQITSIMAENLTAIGVEAHAKAVANCARRREIISHAGMVANLAYTQSDPAKTIVEAVGGLQRLLVAGDSGMVKPSGEMGEGVVGPDWNIPALDRHTMGLVPGHLGILAGSSAEGKSMLAAQIARNVARDGHRVAVFTLEMSNREYEGRIAHAMSGVRQRSSKYDAEYTEHEANKLREAHQTIAGWDFHMSDRGSQSVEMIASAVKSLSTDSPPALIVIDYLQLMSTPDGKESLANNLKAITKRLKQVAVDTNSFVLLLSQMNRASLGELRSKDSRKYQCIVSGEDFPMPFKEALMGGAIENDADVVIQLQAHTDQTCRAEGHIEVCLTKNRHGMDGHGMMISNFALARFEQIKESDIDRIARGSVEKFRRLMKDQGYVE